MTGSQPVCAVCGEVAGTAADAGIVDLALSWSREVVLEPNGRRATTWTCGSCTRRHVRSMEARLDPVWW